MKKSHFTLSRKHRRRPDVSRESEKEVNNTGMRRVGSTNRQYSSKQKMATLSRVKSTKGSTLRAFRNLSSNIFRANKPFKSGLSFNDDDPTEVKTLSSKEDSIKTSYPLKDARTIGRTGQSFRGTLRPRVKQGTLFRKKKVKNVTAESEFRFSQIVVTPLNQDSSLRKQAASLKDANTSSFEIRTSFNETMKDNSGRELRFQEARRFLLQSKNTLQATSSQLLKQPMISDEFENDSRPPPLPPRHADSSRPFLPADVADEFAELDGCPIPPVFEI